MRWIALFISFVIPYFVQAQVKKVWIGDTAQVKTVVIDGDTTYYQHHGSNWSDTCIIYYDPGLQTKARWIVVHGNSVIDTSWYSNGRIKTLEDCTSPECRNTMSWYRSGQLQSKSVCNGDTNVYEEYYLSGQLRQRDIHYSDSVHFKFNLLWHYSAEYYENGQLQFEPVDPNRTTPQPYINYYESGKIKSEGKGYYHAFTGPYTSWYENGQVRAKGLYSEIERSKSGIMESNKTGTWSYYSESGKLIKEEFYEEGKLVKTIEY